MGELVPHSPKEGGEEEERRKGRGRRKKSKKQLTGLPRCSSVMESSSSVYLEGYLNTQV